MLALSSDEFLKFKFSRLRFLSNFMIPQLWRVIAKVLREFEHFKLISTIKLLNRRLLLDFKKKETHFPTFSQKLFYKINIYMSLFSVFFAEI